MSKMCGPESQAQMYKANQKEHNNNSFEELPVSINAGKLFIVTTERKPVKRFPNDAVN